MFCDSRLHKQKYMEQSDEGHETETSLLKTVLFCKCDSVKEFPPFSQVTPDPLKHTCECAGVQKHCFV